MENSAVNKRLRIVRAMEHTPWHHQGRLPGIGIDCIGMIAVTAHQTGYTSYDETDYGRDPADGRLRQMLDRFFTPVRRRFQAGDVLYFEHPKTKRGHVGIAISDSEMMHARAGRKVCKEPVSGKWLNRLTQVYEWAD